ncbi:MAG: hypothetical protein JNM88_00645 [Chitinophagaceae bacterium]|nr:hypothetical protein [Chitinophagaceae bacterium]
MTDYLIQLRPLTPYFFGSENTFGEDSTNYFVRSNYLPQQTTLLGFLRYELLLQNGLLGTDPGVNGSAWNRLIGQESFRADQADKLTDFGAIRKISPLFLSNGTDHYITAPMTMVMYDKDGKEELAGLELSFEETGQSFTTCFRKKVPCLTVKKETYKAKWEAKPVWLSNDGKTIRQWPYEDKFEDGRGFVNGLFIEELQTGIFRKKAKKKTDKEEGDFYKKVSYRLADNFRFSFIVSFDLPPETKFGTRIVTMGGERSVFEMTAAPTNKSFENIFPPSLFAGYAGMQKALVLTSDAFATEDISTLCDYSISEGVPFRNIHTKTVPKGDYTRINGGAIAKAGSLTLLLKRGSVFYGEGLDRVKAALDKPAFSSIGYNQFAEI